jgi:hypothetical protein
MKLFCLLIQTKTAVIHRRLLLRTLGKAGRSITMLVSPTISCPLKMFTHQLLIPSLQTGVKSRSWDHHSKIIFNRFHCNKSVEIKCENMCRYQGSPVSLLGCGWLDNARGLENFLCMAWIATLPGASISGELIGKAKVMRCFELVLAIAQKAEICNWAKVIRYFEFALAMTSNRASVP